MLVREASGAGRRQSHRPLPRPTTSVQSIWVLAFSFSLFIFDPLCGDGFELLHVELAGAERGHFRHLGKEASLERLIAEYLR